MGNKLLLADDSITIRKVVGIIFANEEYELSVVDNGTAAIDKAREAGPDIMLVDVLMPGRNGYEVCEEIRRDPELKDMPLLLLTGAFEPFDEEKARECGADDFISKPFESQQLLEKVNRLLELGNERKAAAKAPEAAEPPPLPPPVPAEEAFTGEPLVAFAQPAESFADDTFILEDVPFSEEIVEALPEDDLWGTFDLGGADKQPAQPRPAIDREFAELENMDLRSLGVETTAPLPQLSPQEAFSPVEENEAPWQQAGETFTIGEDLSAADFGAPPEEELFEFAPEEEAAGFETEAGEVFVLGDEVAEGEIPPDIAFTPSEEIAADPGYELEFAPEEEYVPVATAVSIPSEPAVPPVAAASASAPAGEITLSEEQLAAAISKISREILEKIAWEVVPDMAEMLIREEIRKIKKGIQD